MRVRVMQVSVLKSRQRNFARSAAIVAVSALAAGCSSQVMRFSDDIVTGSTANQRSIISRDAQQPYPADVRAAAPLEPARTERVARTSLDPVTAQPLQAPAPASQPAPALAPVSVPSAPRHAEARTAALDRGATGMVASGAHEAAARQPFPLAAEEDPEGWSRAGGTQITVKSGESVYNLARRFGVPADAIVKANGLASAENLQAGQQIVIPTYVYGERARVSSPDSDPRTREARSSTGTRDVAPGRTPVPSPAPAQRLAVLPERPRTQGAEAQSVRPEGLPAQQQKPEAVAQKPAPARAGGAYTVQAGDSLARIARNHGVSTAALKEANGLSDGLIRIGQQLVIPAAGAAQPAVAQAEPVKATPPKVDTVATGTAGPARTAAQTQAPSTYTPPKQAETVIEESRKVAATAPQSTGIERMRWPVRGRVIAGFGKQMDGKANDGIDIAVPEGTSVKAAENGVVIYAGDGLKDFGNTVLVRHEDGVVTVYGHADSLKVSRGDKVRRGQEIATAGTSGNAEIPKLHFEVRKNSAPVNPMGYLE